MSKLWHTESSVRLNGGRNKDWIPLGILTKLEDTLVTQAMVETPRIAPAMRSPAICANPHHAPDHPYS
eukprot:CAMPEP_0194423504 /NCGR_PEP_ID=MMETSP0176-20130528/22728_1 /TAXON_ID=216777 /ORGANISM="Proboscia alata, Strain PI-D3" /LENGTH=67 /DNA_ID=CAMNT_0039232739 /DNA_START=105 /DNA_END=304 /DNA_ORIENTATION=+